MDIILEVLKWVLVILIAGFIGQFGKSLSLHLIDYYKKKKEKSSLPAPSLSKGAEKKVSPPLTHKEDKKEEGMPVAQESNATPEREMTSGANEQNAKVLKKALKAQVKAKKKARN